MLENPWYLNPYFVGLFFLILGIAIDKFILTRLISIWRKNRDSKERFLQLSYEAKSSYHSHRSSRHNQYIISKFREAYGLYKNSKNKGNWDYLLYELVSVLTYLGNTLISEGEFREARGAFEDATKVLPKTVSPVEQIQVDIDWGLAVAYSSSGGIKPYLENPMIGSIKFDILKSPSMWNRKDLHTSLGILDEISRNIGSIKRYAGFHKTVNTFHSFLKGQLETPENDIDPSFKLLN